MPWPHLLNPALFFLLLVFVTFTAYLLLLFADDEALCGGCSGGTESIIGISNDFSPWWTSISCSDTTSLLPPYCFNVACNIFFLSYSLLSTLLAHSLCAHRNTGTRGCHLTNVGGKSLWKKSKVMRRWFSGTLGNFCYTMHTTVKWL